MRSRGSMATALMAGMLGPQVPGGTAGARSMLTPYRWVPAGAGQGSVRRLDIALAQGQAVGGAGRHGLGSCAGRADRETRRNAAWVSDAISNRCAKLKGLISLGSGSGYMRGRGNGYRPVGTVRSARPGRSVSSPLVHASRSADAGRAWQSTPAIEWLVSRSPGAGAIGWIHDPQA